MYGPERPPPPRPKICVTTFTNPLTASGTTTSAQGEIGRDLFKNIELPSSIQDKDGFIEMMVALSHNIVAINEQAEKKK
ncbi:hypothetical protein SAMD00019534_043910 [Acytostelium subglobosum LB1]|uniref:hypothetical protein n=1 Tax=Acytostelium subglobosum LB1 TaxID=1410327 RepID=UPI000644BACD|nr:hypothetical protein SAMD00019534_043910 [Acytostelium subglobosum LB1]GAM21216.1 hypothetical protein SAMD00019534_043910 [Acytostelium subglobosum LB1]|eukprot:XP_012755335.1 hypothetical protein SAMD00019534_043910 [Acytostelium subglobosum LB1]